MCRIALWYILSSAKQSAHWVKLILAAMRQDFELSFQQCHQALPSLEMPGGRLSRHFLNFEAWQKLNH
jgi:hypothetical protein